MATRRRTKAGVEITSCCPTCGQLVKPKDTKAARSAPVVSRGGPVDYSGPRPAGWLGRWPPLTMAELSALIPTKFDDFEDEDVAVQQ